MAIQRKIIRLLVIEDSSTYARAIRAILEDSATHDFQICHSPNLKGGIQVLETEKIELILLDLMLPDSIGFDTFRRVHKFAPTIPIIVLSGAGDQNVAIQSVKEGAQDYLFKDEHLSALLKRTIIHSLERDQIQKQLLLEIDKNKIEMKIARKIQHSMLPTPLENVDWITTQSAYLPCQTIGGDLFDFTMLDENNLIFYILDVSGHGVSAALIASMAKLSFSNHFRKENDPGVILTKVNKELSELLHDSLFITAFIGRIDHRNLTFYYANAGHPAAFTIHRGKLVLFGNSNNAIGLDANCKYITSTFSLTSKDRILLYTDGATEALNSQNNIFSDERLEKLYFSLREENKETTITTILEELRNFCQNREFSDDITLLLLDLIPKAC
jgi:sigma-B regulation protein RsbU (phosphoserine phosphatase)